MKIEARRWPLLLGALAWILVFLPKLNAPFAWDDQSTIVANRRLEHPIPLRDFVGPKYFEFSREESWRPLGTLSHYALVRLFGPSPAPLRSFNAILHGINGLLLAAFVQDCGLAPEVGFWAAALFWIHPAHVEPLMCVSFDEELLCALGLLLMMRAHRRGKTFAAASGFAFALLSKETGIIGLPLVALQDLLIDPTRPRIRKRGRAYALYAAVACLYLAAHFLLLPGPGQSGGAFVLPFSERIFYALSSMATAVRVFFLPLRLRIEYFALPPASPSGWILRSGSAVAALAVWAWPLRRFYRRNPAVIFLLLWPLPFLALTSNLLPVQVLNMRLFAERWMYLPCLGACGALAYFLRKRPGWSAAVLIFWAACGWARASDWTDETRLWNSLLRVYPWCAKAEEGLAEALSRQGKYPEALAAYRRALELRENRQDKVLQRYAALSRDGFVRWESPTLYRGLGRTYLQLGRIEEAETDFLKASALDPKDGYTYDIMAYRYAETGKFDKSKVWLERGLRELPRDPFLLRLKPDVERRRLSFKAGFY